MRGKTTIVKFRGQRYAPRAELFQYDYGQVFLFTDIDLPQAYEVHFGSAVNGAADPVIGGADGVQVPDKLLETAGNKYAWIFLHEGQDDGETEYVLPITVLARAKNTGTAPTPVQQDVITETIAALNDAVEEVEGIAEWMPQAIEDTLTAAKESGEFDGPKGDDGVSPSVSVSEITGGHRVVVTDAQGTETFDVLDGSKGDPGQDGQDGTDGISPTASVTKSGKTATISITDKNGTTTAQVSDGDDYVLTAQDKAEIAGMIDTSIGQDVSDLKSAFVNEKKGVLSYSFVANSYVATDGTITSYNGWKRTYYTYIGDASLLVAKTSASSNYNCFYDSTKTFIKSFTVGTTDTNIVVPDNAAYVIFSNTNAGMDNLSVSFVTKVQSDLESVDNKLVSDGFEINSVRSAFDNNVVPFALAEFTSGKYIDNSGTEQTNPSMSYTSCTITNDDVGKTIYISGSAWYQIKPFVFVGTSGKVIKSSVADVGSTYTQCTDLPFSPMESGTLYINRYASGSTVQNAKAYYNAVGILKASNFSDAISYAPVSLGTLIDTKLVSAVTGTISDGSSNTQQITDYIEVTGDTYYLITTEMYYGYGLYVWYDADKNFISGKKAENGSSQTQIFCERAKSPSNAAYLVIGYIYQSSFPFPFLMKGNMNAAYPSKRWNGLKWTGIGDSLTEAYTVTGAHYFDLICAATGISFVNKGVSGTGYAKGTSNFMTRALTVAADSDVVTFFGSGNDASAGLDLGTATDTGTTTIGGCINTAIDNIYSVNPIMNIGLITPTPWQGNMPSDDGFMEGYSNLIIEICKRRSIPCLDLFHCSGLNPNSAAVRAAAYSRDNGGGVHPDENGHALFAPRILAFLDTLLMH